MGSVLVGAMIESQQSEQEFSKYLLQLEDLVQKRTNELMKVNEQLKSEIITRKQVEEALRESEEKFRALAEKSPNMISVNK